MRNRCTGRRAALFGMTLGLIESQLALAARPTLSLATGAREPLVSSISRPGFVEELAREALRRVGHDLRVVPLPHERALVNANSGTEDGDLYRAAGFEKDFPNLAQVPESLLDQDFVAVARRPDLSVRSWRDLAEYSVAYVTGNKILERHLEGYANVTSVRDNALLFGLLATDRVDVVLINRWVGLVAARQAGLAIRVQEPPLLRVAMYMYLHRRHAALIPPLAAALAMAKRDGTWQRLYDQILKPLEAQR